MNIEFDYPAGEMKPWIVNQVRDRLLEWHRRDAHLTRAHVIFHSETEIALLKICEIKIPGFGSELYIHTSGDSYETATREMLQVLQSRMETRIKTNQEPPDIVTSSVRI